MSETGIEQIESSSKKTIIARKEDSVVIKKFAVALRATANGRAVRYTARPISSLRAESRAENKSLVRYPARCSRKKRFLDCISPASQSSADM